jgi:lipopolysaccharide biosynthesis glycosyltransferase
MATMIQSIMENADQNRQYVFYILHQEIHDDNMELLKKQISLFHHFSIKFINVIQFISKYNLFISRQITIEAYFRLLIPELLSEYQKAIYLDGDMICCTDISSLFDINLDNYLLAAVRDIGVAWHYSKKSKERTYLYSSVMLRLKNYDDYFCSAMTVFNIELFRKTITTEKLFELAMSREWQIHDQDILNFLAEGKTLLLPYHWNFMYTEWAKYLPEYLRQEYNDASKHPKIIHYKPWKNEFNIPHFQQFWKYATRTPFIEEIIRRMESKKLISPETIQEVIINNIERRNGLGLRFILNCAKAWLFRKKKKTIHEQ